MRKIKAYYEIFSSKIKGYKRKRENSRRFQLFYLSSKEDTRSNGAKIFDYVIARFFIFFATYFLAAIILGGLLKSLFLATITLTLFHLISIEFRKNKLDAMKKIKRKEIAGAKVYQELVYKTAPELIEYIEDFLKRNGLYSIEKIHNNSVNFIYKVKDEESKEFLIGFFVYKKEYYVEVKAMKEFLFKMRDMKLEKGMIITTSDFTTDSYGFIEKVKDKFRIIPVNHNQFQKLVEGSGLYPRDEEIDEIIENRISKREASWKKYKEIALAKKKIRGYVFLSVFLFFAALFSPFPIYYMTISGLAMGLAFIIFLRKYIFKNKMDESYSTLSQLLEKQ
ncbi:restriction endonuclease [Alkaliphilus serpentinus]|uniref:Restriction endonuclease n=1 Tax=Alkaliphilus serpentinus TaxID=1482731 RepID=A0A833HRK5_9FIRM|nr:restriction endonuclease [Alkaliphilus serpentinus]KAB3533210.1 restriction endonuclease [Alkaliphilus serpentinus]